MAKRWMGVALLTGWLGVSSSAPAQVAAPPGATGAGSPPASAQGGGKPADKGSAPGYPEGSSGGYPGPAFCPPPPPLNAPVEDISLPPNSFSNVHPELETRSPRCYLDADYLLWWVRKRQVPPLVSSGSLSDQFPGALGQPGTVAVVGPGSLDTAQIPGVRLTGTFWFDQEHVCGLDASGFILEERSVSRAIGGYGNTTALFARPFFNPNSGLPDADPLEFPNVQAGNIGISLPRTYWGGDANFRYGQPVECFGLSRVTMLAGVRYMYLREKIDITEIETDLPDVTGAAGNITRLQDGFATTNQFYGGQIGLELESHVGPVALIVTGKVAGGENHQTLTIGGNTTVYEPTGSVTYDATRGLLVQPTNAGRFTRNHIGIVPEFAFTLALEFNEHLRASVGYNFLYWSNVIRPGDQIDPVVNVGAAGDPGQFGTSPHPLIPWHSTAFWAQGLNVGVQVSY